MQTLISENSFEGWNEFLSKNPAGNFYQTTFYAQYAKNIGLKPLYLRVVENNAVLGQLLLFKSALFYGFTSNIKISPLAKISTTIMRKIFPRYKWTYGPVTENKEACQELLKIVNQLAATRKIECSTHPFSEFEEEFRKNGFKEKKWGTFLIDLALPEETLWKNVDKATRKTVTRTLEQVEINHVNTEKEYREYHEIVNENRKRNNVTAYSYDPSLWKIWKDTGTGAVVIAREKNSKQVLAGLGISNFNGYLNEWGAGTADKAIKEHIYAQDAIKWHVITWAKKNNAEFFDLTGVNPTPENEKEKGIYRFKEKWGGKLYLYSQYHKN